MQASDKFRGSVRRRRAVYSVAAVAGVAALVNMPKALQAGTVFNDTFGTSTINTTTNTPTSTSTNYDTLSTKDSSGSAITAGPPGNFSGHLAAGTASGGWEAQALFTTAPVTLVNTGDSIEIMMVFTPTNILAGGTSSTLGLGLYNSHGQAPNNGLSNSGLSTAASSPFAIGNAQAWEGYVGLFAESGGNNNVYVRPVQNSALDPAGTSANQDALFSGAGSGFFTNPKATNATPGVSSLATLSSTNVYTDDLLLTLNADNSVTILSSLYNGSGKGTAAIQSQTGNVPAATIKTFDALAFGAFNKGTLLNPQLDVSSLTITTAAAATLTNLTWDPGATGTGSDGSGNWETANHTWAASGADGAWVNDGTSTAVIGSGGPAGTLTITVPNINAAGINFNSGYTIAANAGSTLTLTAPAVNVAAGATVNMNAPIAGNVGLSSTGPGSLVLNASNTYTGGTTVGNGTLVLNAGGNLGAATNGLVIGTSGTSSGTTPTNTGALILNTSATVGALTSSTNNTTANTIAINGSSVLTVNGVTTVGLSSSATSPTATALTITGNELDVNNTMNIGLAYTGSTTISNTTLDMSGLTTFKMNATGASQAFNFGAAQEAAGTVILANTANTITTNTINVGTTTSNSGRDTLEFGAATNVLDASNMNIGTGKGSGAVQFAGVTGSVTIAGITGGASTANITIGSQSTGTAASGTSTLNLSGHSATVQAATMIVGQLNGAANGQPSGSVSFDTGTMTIDSLQIANNASGNATNGVIGAFTLGTDQTSTGVLTVNTQFSLANLTNTVVGSPAKGTFTINGGVANIKADIVVGFGAGAALGTGNTTLQLATGTLNMNGHAIGPVTGSSIAINNVILPSTGHAATLMNLGGDGINSNGLTMNGTGTLNLDGANTYTGPTAVSAGGTLAVLSTGSLPSASNVTVDGTLTLNNPAQTIASLNGSTPGALVNLNAANLTVATGGAYAGAVNDNGSNGTLNVGGALSVGSFNVGAVNANATVQIHGTSKAKALNLTGPSGGWTSGLDLTSSKFILESTPGNKNADLTRIRDQVKFGKTNANGIFTTTVLPANYAIAVLDNAVLNKGTFGGVGTTTNSVLVSAEMLGDANADGTIDTSDLNIVLNHFGSVTPAWTSGNFDGAATVDLTDLAFVLNNFGANNPNATDAFNSGGGVSPAIGAPEPAALSIMAAALVPSFLRRRRRNA